MQFQSLKKYKNDNEFEKDIPKDKTEVNLYQSIRWFILVMFMIIGGFLLINVGIFSSSIKQIQIELKLSNKQFSFLSQASQIGKVFGTFVFMAIFNKFNRKYLILIPLILGSMSLVFFTFVTNYYLLIVSKSLSGFCQVFALTYFPIWIDQIGISKKKTRMLTLFHLSAPFGMVTGYALSNFIGRDNWRKGLWIESGGEILFVFILLFIPKIYFSQNIAFKYHFDNTTISSSTTSEDIEKENNNNSFNSNNSQNAQNNNNEGGRYSVFYVPKPIEKTNNNKNNSKKKKNYFLENALLLIHNKIFIFSVLYKTTNQIICVGLTVWLTSYLTHQLNTPIPSYQLYTFIVVIVIGPILGLIFGGIITSKTGGYEIKKSVLVMCIMHIISSLIGLCVVLTNNIIVFNVILCLYFMFNYSVTPVITGLVLWSMPRNLKGIGNGISGLMSSFLGKVPAPFIYTLLQDNFGEVYNKIGMLGLMSTSLISGLFLVLTTIFRYKIDIKNNNKNSKEQPLNEKNEDKFNEELRDSINKETIANTFNSTNLNEVIEKTDKYFNKKAEEYMDFENGYEAETEKK